MNVKTVTAEQIMDFELSSLSKSVCRLANDCTDWTAFNLLVLGMSHVKRLGRGILTLS